MESKQRSEIKSINIKTTKTNAILNNRKLQKIATVFRFIETIFLLIMISRFSYQLPSAVKLSGDYYYYYYYYYFRGSNFTAFSPKFVFVIGNLIILILYLKSRLVDNIDEIGNTDSCYEYVKSCERSVVNCTDHVFTDSPVNVVVVREKRKISRSKSEDPISVKCRDGENRRELRRSVTEVRRENNVGDGGKEAVVVVKDELNCEDFRRTVEAFIARQQKILRDEEFSPMVCVSS